MFLPLWWCGYGQTVPDSWAMGMPVLWHGWVLADAAKLLSVWCASGRLKGSLTTLDSRATRVCPSDNEGEGGGGGGGGGEEEVVPDAPKEQDSGGSGAVGDSARLVAGTAKKGGVLVRRMF